MKKIITRKSLHALIDYMDLYDVEFLEVQSIEETIKDFNHEKIEINYPTTPGRNVDF